MKQIIKFLKKMSVENALFFLLNVWSGNDGFCFHGW